MVTHRRKILPEENIVFICTYGKRAWTIVLKGTEALGLVCL